MTSNRTPNGCEMWCRMDVYTLDDPSAAYPFTARLAVEQGWTRGYAARVADEYKRFVYLGVTCGHPVTPSSAVDEAWHLHLLYTRSYWDDLCGNVLGRPFHHEPTRGGRAEDAKFQDWYGKTLRAYAEAFGAEPPEDIWPRPQASRVDRPSRRLGRVVWAAVAVAGVLSVASTASMAWQGIAVMLLLLLLAVLGFALVWGIAQASLNTRRGHRNEHTSSCGNSYVDTGLYHDHHSHGTHESHHGDDGGTSCGSSCGSSCGGGCGGGD